MLKMPQIPARKHFETTNRSSNDVDNNNDDDDDDDNDVDYENDNDTNSNHDDNRVYVMSTP